MSNVAMLVSGGFTALFGYVIGAIGFALAVTEVGDAGPFPIKTPTDYHIVIIGLVLWAFGSIVGTMGLDVIGVL